MIKRLYEQEWITGKISSLQLLPLFYAGLSPTGQKELNKIFNSALENENV